MKIKMNTLYAGPAGVMEPGSIHDVSEQLGQTLVNGLYAQKISKPAPPVETEPAAPSAPVETIETTAAPTEPVETAVTSRPPRRKKS